MSSLDLSDKHSVVILGCGIIGLSTAYYLSTSPSPPARVYILDTSPVLFECASGRAGGFITKDWYGWASKELGELSFRLHRELADENDGRRQWGYSGSLGLSVTEIKEETPSARSNAEDQLFDGQSRRFMAGEFSTLWAEAQGEWPQWLKKGDAKLLSTEETTAQVNPRHLCEFFLRRCQEQGVHILHPATATRVSTDAETGLPVSLSYTTPDSSENTIPCTSLLLATGPWVARTYKDLFPTSKLKLPVSNIAGWSIVFRDSSPSSAEFTACHAAFIDTKDFSPEVFSRILPDGQRDIYLAGVNSSEVPLPVIATDVASTLDMQSPQITSLLKVARAILTPAPDSGDIPQIIQASLCHRPVTTNRTPIIARFETKHYSPHAGKDAERVKGGVYVCGGHGPWGISLGPGSGNLCANLIMGQTEPPPFLSKLGLQ